MKEVNESPEMKQKLAEMGVEPGNLYGDEFREFVDREIERWAVVVKNANIPRSKFSSITCDKAKAGILDAGLLSERDFRYRVKRRTYAKCLDEYELEKRAGCCAIVQIGPIVQRHVERT
jgi:hypothetical protein